MGAEGLALSVTLFVFTLFQQWMVLSHLPGTDRERPKRWTGRGLYIFVYLCSFTLAGETAQKLRLTITSPTATEIGSLLLLSVSLWSLVQSWIGTRPDDGNAESKNGVGYPFVLLSQCMEAYSIGLGIAFVTGFTLWFAGGVAVASSIAMMTRVPYGVSRSFRTLVNSCAAFSGLLMAALSLIR